MSAWQTWFLKHLTRFLVKTTTFYVISWSTVWENAEHYEIRFILNASWNIKIATWMDAHELCMSGVLEEHVVPTPPNPQPLQHPHPSRSSAGWGGVLESACVFVSAWGAAYMEGCTGTPLSACCRPLLGDTAPPAGSVALRFPCRSRRVSVCHM